MDRSQLRRILIAIIKKYQTLSGEDIPEEVEKEDESCSMGKVEGFDSVRGTEVSADLERDIGENYDIQMEKLIELFDPDQYDDVDEFEDITIGHILDKLENKLA